MLKGIEGVKYMEYRWYFKPSKSNYYKLWRTRISRGFDWRSQ